MEPVDEHVFVLEKTRLRLYSCMGLCLSIAKVRLVRSKEVLFLLVREPRACVCVHILPVLNSLAAPFCMTRWGPLSNSLLQPLFTSPSHLTKVIAQDDGRDCR